MEFKPFRLGDYLLLERLATGGMAEVYRGKLRGAGGFEKQLAIKRILPHYSSNEEFVRMFEFEARLSSQLTHANIVQIFNFQKISGAYLLTMEFVNGKNLRQFVNKVKKTNYSLSVACAVYVINEVCKGLDYAHSRRDESEGKPLNIIHRDMSPQNVMLSYEGAVKIVDFGIAKARDRADETRSGVIKGKFGYMSPEQANGEPVDMRTDIFSTGIMLYELVTGKRLFQTDNDLATLKLIQECLIPLPTKANPKISLELEKIILRSLSKDRNARFQTAGQMHRALQEFLNKNFPSFTQKELADILHGVFVNEMESEQRRSEEINRQSIPFSQGEMAAKKEEVRSSSSENSSSIQDESVTKFEKEEDTGFTFGDDSGLSDILKDIEDQSKTGRSANSASAPVSTAVSKSSSTTQQSESTEAKTSVAQKQQQEAATQIKTVVKEKTPAPVQVQKRNFSEITNVDEEQGTSVDTSHTQKTSDVTKIDSSVGASIKTQQGSFIKPQHTPTPTLPNMNGMARDAGNTKKSISFPNKGETKSEVPSSPASESLSTDTQGNYRMPKAQPKIELENESGSWHETPSSEDRQLKSAKSSFSWVNMVLVAVITFSFIQIYQRMQAPVPVVVETLPPERPVAEEEAKPAQETPAPIVPTPAAQVAQEMCTLKAETDPPGATWTINGEEKGTVGAALVPCDEWVEVVVKKPGYEEITNRIKSQKRMKEPYRFTLKVISEGLLEFKLNYRAKVFADGNELRTYEADQTYQLALPSGKGVKLRFLNETLGIDTQATVIVRKDVVERKEFKIDELPKYR